MNFDKLTDIAAQPTNCETTTQRVPGGYYASLEMKDDSRGNSIKTSWMFRHSCEVTDFLEALESSVAKARQEFPAVLDQVAISLPSDIEDVAFSISENEGEDPSHAADSLMGIDEDNMPAAVQIESGHDSGGYFATIYIYDEVGASTSRSLSFETKDELLEFFDSIRDSVAQAEQHVEDADRRLRRAGDSGNTYQERVTPEPTALNKAL